MRPRKPKQPPQPSSARESALRALGRREHSAAELKHKLKIRGHGDDTVAEVVGDLAERGWQSDERYAEMLVRNRVGQGYGPQRIQAELSAAGVSDAEIRAALDAADCDWKALAASVHTRKFKTPPSGAAEWQKHYRFLAGRGFEPDQIRAALKAEAPEDGAG